MWAPWRKAYLRSSSPKRSGCIFCRFLKEKKDKKNLVLFRAVHHAVILNRYPYNNGHLMIVPNRHIACLSEMNTREKEEFFDVLEKSRRALQKAMRPQGFNVGMNIADVAGAGIPGHLHWHIVPRWKGDVNFMPVVGGTKVISESLESAYEVLNRALGRRTGISRKVRRRKK
jgi:ATP adenylyltransferase